MRANLDNEVISFEQYNELAKGYARFDDGLDDDFLEEEWQFVHESDKDDEDEADPVDRPATPNWYIDEDDDDTDDDDATHEDEEDLDWDAGTEDYEDDDDKDEAWYENDDEEE